MKHLTFFLFLALASPALAEPQETITIGANLALTGKLSFNGKAQASGLELAIAQINKEGGLNGVSVALQVEDNAGDAKQAVASIQRQLDVSAIRLFFVGLTHIVQSVRTPLTERGALMIYAAGIPDPAEGNEKFFRDWGDAEAEGEVLAVGIAGAGKRTSVYLGEENDSCSQLRAAFERKSAELGASVLKLDSYNPGETDFRSILLRLVTLKPDAIALCAFRDSGLIMQQLKALGRIDIPVYHTLAPFIPANDTPEVRRLYEENGSVTSWFGFVPDDPTNVEADFISSYRTRFGETPRIEAALAYDDMRAFAAAARKCPLDGDLPSCIGRTLASSAFEGVCGRLTFDNRRRANRKDFLMRVTGGRWQRIGSPPG